MEWRKNINENDSLHHLSGRWVETCQNGCLLKFYHYSFNGHFRNFLNNDTIGMVRVADRPEYGILQKEVMETDVGDYFSELSRKWFQEEPSYWNFTVTRESSGGN